MQSFCTVYWPTLLELTLCKLGEQPLKINLYMKFTRWHLEK